MVEPDVIDERSFDPYISIGTGFPRALYYSQMKMARVDVSVEFENRIIPRRQGVRHENPIRLR